MAAARPIDSVQLRQLGIDPAIPAAEAIAALRQLLASNQADTSAIARALATLPVPEAAEILASMEHGASGTGRREIRRALFKLHQRGIEPPHQAAAPARPAGEIFEAGLSAVLSPIDGDGARVVWILKTRSNGGLRRIWGVVSERDGVAGVTLDSLTRKELRAERKEIEKRAGVTLIDADWRLADFILSEAWRNTPEARRLEVGDFLAARSELIAAAPPSSFKHPIYAEFADRLSDEPSPDLMKEPEIAGWQLPPEVVKPYADEAADLRNSVIVLNRMQQEERVNLVIERAAGEIFSGMHGERLRRHLEDTAYYFSRTRRPREAAAAAAAAARIRDNAELKRSPFFQAFIRAQLGAVIAESEEHERQEPRLIMTPAEAMRARQQALERRRGLSR
ncbi:MAG TPA: hypothetical protein VMF50_04170 [Candidatus Binataceae bacterium]|nr:hypothetical protein [Candidatus Binataceae bacterium]